MTQIKKTLSIAGIIALITAPAMAEIASTQYVQNVVNTKQDALPSGTAGQILTQTDNGIQWTDAPEIPELPENIIANTATGAYSFAVGNDAEATGDGATAIGSYASASGDNSLAINGVTDAYEAIAIGSGDEAAYAGGEVSIAIGAGAYVEESAGSAIAIGGNANVDDDAKYAIQLGVGTNSVARTFNVGFGYNEETDETDNYTLLESDGTIPYERFAPTPDATCKASVGQKCALVVTWDGTKYSQSWEVVRSTSSGQ